MGSAARLPGFRLDLPFTNCWVTLGELPISLYLSFQICSMSIKRKCMYMIVVLVISSIRSRITWKSNPNGGLSSCSVDESTEERRHLNYVNWHGWDHSLGWDPGLHMKKWVQCRHTSIHSLCVLDCDAIHCLNFLMAWGLTSPQCQTMTWNCNPKKTLSPLTCFWHSNRNETRTTGVRIKKMNPVFVLPA